VRPCQQALRDVGYFVGVVGNQTARAGRFLRELPNGAPSLTIGGLHEFLSERQDVWIVM
jgi:hypothetical protein